jgi:hypothetical protein
MGWALHHGIRHILIQPGRPMQNGYIESFNGRFRDECLNDHWFQTLHQARTTITAWRRDYNEVRPHGSIDGSHRRRSPRSGAANLPRHFSTTTTATSTNLATRTSSQQLVRCLGARQHDQLTGVLKTSRCGCVDRRDAPKVPLYNGAIASAATSNGSRTKSRQSELVGNTSLSVVGLSSAFTGPAKTNMLFMGATKSRTCTKTAVGLPETSDRG